MLPCWHQSPRVTELERKRMRRSERMKEICTPRPRWKPAQVELFARVQRGAVALAVNAEAEPAVHLRLRVEDARGAARVTLHAALHAAHELAPSLRRSRVHPAGSGSAWAHPVLHALHVAVGAHEGEPAARAGRGGLVVVLTVQHRSPPSLVAHPLSLFMFFMFLSF